MQATPGPAPQLSGAHGGTGAYIAASILIIIGSLTLVANVIGSDVVGQAIVLAIGLAFFVAYLMTRQYGFLVPAGILMGVGAGILIAWSVGAGDDGPYAVLGGGAGFLLIFAVDALVHRTSVRWWPVIPGSIMLVVGSGMATQNEGLIRQIGIWSPVLLIVIGLLILLARSRPAPR